MKPGALPGKGFAFTAKRGFGFGWRNPGALARVAGQRFRGVFAEGLFYGCERLGLISVFNAQHMFFGVNLRECLVCGIVNVYKTALTNNPESWMPVGKIHFIFVIYNKSRNNIKKNGANANSRCEYWLP